MGGGGCWEEVQRYRLIFVKYITGYANVLFKRLGSVTVRCYFFKHINTFIHQGCIKVIKSDNKRIYSANKCCSFGLSIHI